jgi:hypothetical protein
MKESASPGKPAMRHMSCSVSKEEVMIGRRACFV